MDIQPAIDFIKGQFPGIVLGAGTVLTGFFTLMGKGFVAEFFEKRKRVDRHRIDVARKVKAICNEASTGNYKKAARDMEHVNSIMTDLDGIDKKMGIIMNSFVSAWHLSSTPSYVYESIARIEHTVEQNRNLDNMRKRLIDWSNKIINGKR